MLNYCKQAHWFNKMNFKRENSLIRPHTDLSITDNDYFIGLSFVPIIILSLLLLFIVFLVTCYFIPKCRLRDWRPAKWVTLFFTIGAIVSWLVAFGISASHARYDLDDFIEPFKEVHTLLKDVSIHRCNSTDSETESIRQTIEVLTETLGSIVDLFSVVSSVIDKLFLSRTIVASIIAIFTAATLPVLYRHNIYVLVVPMLSIAMIVACLLYVLALVSVDLCYPNMDETLLRVFGELDGSDGPVPDCAVNSTSDSIMALCYYQHCDPDSLFVSRYLNQTLEYHEIPPEEEAACPGITANLNKTRNQIENIMEHLTCEHIPYDKVIRHDFCKVQTNHEVRLFYAYISSTTVTMVAILAVMFLVVEKPNNRIIDAELVPLSRAPLPRKKILTTNPF